MTDGMNRTPEGDSPKRWPRVQKAFEDVLILGCGKVLDWKDFTVFIKREEFIEAANRVLIGLCPQLPASSEACPETIDLSGKVCINSESVGKACRLHAALCFGTEYYSVTIRKKLEPNQKWEPGQFPLGRLRWKELKKRLRFSSIEDGEWNAVKGQYASSLYSLAEILFPAIFGDDPGPASGLVLITGGTGTGKTTVLNGLLGKYVWRILNSMPKRRPHVVAAGDPVETVFYAVGDKDMTDSGRCQSERDASYFSNPIDFTARVLGTDVIDVGHALKDALRETTSAYVISELREDEDFASTLRFAATGQLVFATAHNTSLVDALRKLMLISRMGEHASARSILAQRLKAVVHLQQMQLTSGASITLPSVWLGNAAGVRNFVCDGLASLLPHGPHEPDIQGGSDIDPAYKEGTVGLSWAVHELMRRGLVLEGNVGDQENVKRLGQERDLIIH